MTSLTRGRLSLYSGRPATAIRSLEHALELNPKSVEIKIVLAQAYLDARQLDAHNRLLKELSETVPSTTSDELYLGSWLAGYDPPNGYAMAVKAHRRTQPAESTLARLLATQARWQFLQDSGNFALVDKTATLGMPLRLDVRLVNDSDDTYLIPLMRRHRRSREVMSGLSLLLYREGKRDPEIVRLPVKSVEQITPSLDKKDNVPGEVFLRTFASEA